MTATCPGCGTAYRGDDVNLTTGLARCRACDRIELLGGAPVAEAVRPRRGEPVAELARPPAFTEGTDADGFHLRFRWYHPGVWFLLFFCIAWDGFLVVWYGSALAMAATDAAGPMFLMFVFPLAHVAVGVGLTWHTLATLLNTTTFTVGRGRLRVSHGPVPWWGGVDEPTSRVSQLYVSLSPVRRNKQHSYRVHALVDGTARELLSGIPDLANARYLERRLEERLGIDDAPIVGEVR